MQVSTELCFMQLVPARRVSGERWLVRVVSVARVRADFDESRRVARNPVVG